MFLKGEEGRVADRPAASTMSRLLEDVDWGRWGWWWWLWCICCTCCCCCKLCI